VLSAPLSPRLLQECQETVFALTLSDTLQFVWSCPATDLLNAKFRPESDKHYSFCMYSSDISPSVYQISYALLSRQQKRRAAFMQFHFYLKFTTQ
jgi:hypothetical protein